MSTTNLKSSQMSDAKTETSEKNFDALSDLKPGTRAFNCTYSCLELDKRWMLLRKDLEFLGYDNKRIDSYFEDFYRAYYFIVHDRSSTAVFFRGLYDVVSNNFRDRKTKSQGYPVITIFLYIFLAMSSGRRTIGEMVHINDEINAFLQVILPGMPVPSNHITTRVIYRLMQLMDDSEMKALICAINIELRYLLEGIKFKAPEFNRQTARDNFAETSDILNMPASLESMQIDTNDLMKRFGKYIHRRTVLATNLEDKPQNTFIDYLYQSVNKRLASAQLDNLSEDQTYQLLLHLFCRLSICDHVVLCENTPEQIKLIQEMKSIEVLKREGPTLIDENQHFEPAQVYPTCAPEECFSGGICDLLNDYIMPLTEDPKHPNYKEESRLTKIAYELAEKTVAPFHVVLRRPTVVRDLEHETLKQYTISMYDLADQAFEYRQKSFKGKMPVQQWKTIVLVTCEEIPAGVARKAMQESDREYKDQFKDLMMKAMNYDDLERQISATIRAKNLTADEAIVSIQKATDLRSYQRQRQFSIINGRMSGALREKRKLEEGEYFIPGIIKTFRNEDAMDGDELLRLPENKQSRTLTTCYICSLEVSAESFMDIASTVDPYESMVAKYYKKNYGDTHYCYSVDAENLEFSSLDELKNSLISLQRMLNTRQVRSSDLLLQGIIKDALENEPYFVLDAFVLFSQSISSLILDRKNKVW